MKQRRQVFRWSTASGETITVGDTRLTPESRALVCRVGSLGFSWNRPVAVVVETGNTRQRIPVVDATRQAQLAILAFVVALWGLALALSVRRRSA